MFYLSQNRNVENPYRSDMTDVEGMINALIAALLPVINAEIPEVMVEEGLDPLEEVLSGSDTLGKINLGICTAKVKVNYNISDMKGLSSLYINSMEIDECKINGDESNETITTVVGSAWISVELTSDLSAKVGGSVEASCGGIDEKVGLSGKVTAGGVKGKGSTDFTVTLSAEQACFEELKITDFSLSYKDIDVDIDGLGIFNEFLQPLIDLINDVFGDYIEDALSPVVKDALNGLLKDMMPACASY